MSTLAHAAVLDAVDAPFVFQDIELQDPKPDELLVRIVATGLCHTDLAVQHGHIPSAFPRVLGHEGAGIVERVGEATTGFAPGDHVALSFASCGHCENCVAGRVAYCLDFMTLNVAGVRADGSGTMAAPDGGDVTGSFFGQSSFASYSLVAARNAVKIDASIPLELVGPLGCGVQTGAGTVLNSLGVGAGDALVVSGAGAVGLSAIMAAKAAGATTIVAVDVLPERLEVARELGATHVVDGRADDVVDQIKAATGGVGAPFAIDTTAIPAVIGNLVASSRFGAKVATVGVPKPDAVVPAGLFSGSGVTLIGAIEGDSVPQTFIPKLLAMYQAGDFPFDRLVTTYPFAEIEKAIADTQSGAAVKAVLVLP
ncbi:NAD(P)-dependent alcohol dehydrogenase [Microbacterium sp. cx-55]|uniref:NAD(P)-dependent alcohol dehydrogenase n=1 Tax=unclassified Microbacterium TaxID=2609290 RepID=UPI001CBD66F1|nr:MULTISPECIES: NAD(P)-dependent alcohol dehydrogenase [unclassified Microbacterium]MBZ4487293.1 NAD(P)-dependent alcohol dehydrogenase [Microbacterium sp. cx-55]MCC4908590.1 NAD(P)-dependent alcohol dehydrogenase [Microbacterium sp. cx-59]UGB35315.1 NAD(P)-dependent alcohol dehydrogenase [Microbacterium sp. cx-55]